MSRITSYHLDRLATRINVLIGAPLKPREVIDGKCVNYPDCVFIESAYGGYAAAQMAQGGGERRFIESGYVKASILYEQLHAWIRGYEYAQAQLAASVNKRRVTARQIREDKGTKEESP